MQLRCDPCSDLLCLSLCADFLCHKLPQQIDDAAIIDVNILYFHSSFFLSVLKYGHHQLLHWRLIPKERGASYKEAECSPWFLVLIQNEYNSF